MPSANDKNLRRTFLAMLMLSAAGSRAFAGPLRQRLAERRAAQEEPDDDDGEPMPPSLAADMQVVHDVAYGRDDEQRFDVYLPHSNQLQNAPVIFMVHGGGWHRGDKAMRSVVANKAAHWVTRGFVFISTNYRLLPKAAPLEQAEDVARAVAHAQHNVAPWGGDMSKFILMGHSAGAHLVALISADPAKAQRIGAVPWRGSVLLDSAALDVPKIMEDRHFPLYDRAFGRDPAYWRRASPYHQLTADAAPMLAVCSSQRATSVQQSREFAAKANSMGVRTQVLPEDLSHREINIELGIESAYTRAVDGFIASVLR